MTLSLDALYDSESESGSPAPTKLGIRLRHSLGDASYFAKPADATPLHHSLGAMCPDGFSTPPGLTPAAPALTPPGLSLTPPPKRKSLSERINEDHPGSASRSSPSASPNEGVRPQPDALWPEGARLADVDLGPPALRRRKALSVPPHCGLFLAAAAAAAAEPAPPQQAGAWPAADEAVRRGSQGNIWSSTEALRPAPRRSVALSPILSAESSATADADDADVVYEAPPAAYGVPYAHDGALAPLAVAPLDTYGNALAHAHAPSPPLAPAMAPSMVPGAMAYGGHVAYAPPPGYLAPPQYVGAAPFGAPMGVPAPPPAGYEYVLVPSATPPPPPAYYGGAPPPPPPTEAASAIRWGRLAGMATDAKGSRALQAELPRMSGAQLGALLAELGPHLLGLAMHTFGNYLVSKLAPLPPSHAPLAAAFRGHVVELMRHPQGSRVVQAALAALPAAASAELASELVGHVAALATDTHGCWGVIAAFEHTHAPSLLAEVVAHLRALALDQHGCRVVQSIIRLAHAAAVDVRHAVAAVLADDVPRLATHGYGNYAVQAALRASAGGQRAEMLARLLPRALDLATRKHGSNVVELLLELAPAPELAALDRALFGGAPDADASLRTLMAHPFGNYVLQALVRRLEAAPRAAALEALRRETTATNYGRSIVARCASAADEAPAAPASPPLLYSYSEA